jgi:hypothetical protein
MRKELLPRVMQRELSDFYVQYTLLAHLEEPQKRAAVLSELHAQIQDAFNEYGENERASEVEKLANENLFSKPRL